MRKRRIRIRTEITATDHCGYLRFTFPQGSNASILIEATRPGIEGFVTIDADQHEVSGYNPDRMDSNLGPLTLPNFKGYFVVRFKQAFAAQELSTKAVLMWPDMDRGRGHQCRRLCHLRYRRERGGRSAGRHLVHQHRTGAGQSRRGIAGLEFRRARASALKATWNRKLGHRRDRLARPRDQRHIFYTGLYHALLYPKLFSEHGRYYSAFDDKVHAGTSYTAFSIWDTFRAENSLLTLFAPERIDGMVKALLQNYTKKAAGCRSGRILPTPTS